MGAKDSKLEHEKFNIDLLKESNNGNLPEIKKIIEKHGANVNSKYEYIDKFDLTKLNQKDRSKLFSIEIKKNGEFGKVKYFYNIIDLEELNDEFKFGEKKDQNDIIFLKKLKRKSASGMTSFHIACCRGNLPIVKYLHEQKANINLPDKCKNTPLINSINNRHSEVTQYLINSKADINYENEIFSPIKLSVMIGDNKFAKKYLDESHLNEKWFHTFADQELIEFVSDKI